MAAPQNEFPTVTGGSVLRPPGHCTAQPRTQLNKSPDPLVNEQFAIEAMAIEIVDFPINSMVDLSIVM